LNFIEKSKKNAIFKHSNNINYLIHPLNPPPAGDSAYFKTCDNFKMYHIPRWRGIKGVDFILLVTTKYNKHIQKISYSIIIAGIIIAIFSTE
jgi:hypothetical protein